MKKETKTEGSAQVNRSESMRVRSSIKAGHVSLPRPWFVHNNHNESMKVRSGVKAGNHGGDQLGECDNVMVVRRM